MRLTFSTLLTLTFAACLNAQSTSRLEIVPPQTDTDTGTVFFREKYANGTQGVSLQAPASVAATYTLRLPGALPLVSGCLEIDSTGQLVTVPCGPSVSVTSYQWSESQGNLAAGVRTLNFSPCPMNASDTTYKFRVYDGITSEVVQNSGTGTCVTGAASGTVQVTLVNSYTSATATSASDGWQEAIYSVADGNYVTVTAPVGNYNVYADILTGSRAATINCEGNGAVLFPRANNLKVFNVASPSSIKGVNCAINNAYAHTGVTGIYAYANPGSTYGTYLTRMVFTGMQYGVYLGTAYLAGLFENQFVNNSTAALYIGQGAEGDAGIGLISGNLIVGSGSETYGILWNGPGNLKVQGNSFNGFVEQIHLEATMGVVNVSGADVTWVSGNKFRSAWAGVRALVASSTVSSLIDTVTDDEHLVLAVSQPTCNNCRYYVGNTGQMQLMNNTMDAGVNTTYGMRFVGDIPFYNFQVNGNFYSNPTQTAHKSISIEGVGWYFGSVQHNNIQTSVGGTTIGVNITDGNYITVADNQIVNLKTGVNVGAAAVGVKAYANNCTDLTNTTNCTLSAAAGTLVQELTTVTFSQLSAYSSAVGSTAYCTDCKPALTNNTCVGSGPGAFARRSSAGWFCDNATNAGGRIVQGAQALGTTMSIGTTDANGILFSTNNLGRWFIATDGHFGASDNTLDIGTDGADRPRGVYAGTVTKSATFATNTNCSSAASPAVCTSAAAGSVVVAAAATTVVVNTTAVTANSQILITEDSSLGTKLGVTCNTNQATNTVTARSAGTSFTITTSAAPVTNPRCYSFSIIN